MSSTEWRLSVTRVGGTFWRPPLAVGSDAGQPPDDHASALEEGHPGQEALKAGQYPYHRFLSLRTPPMGGVLKLHLQELTGFVDGRHLGSPFSRGPRRKKHRRSFRRFCRF